MIVILNGGVYLDNLVLLIKRGLFSFWFLIVAAAVLALGVTIYLYRFKFGGELSANSSEWSAFGAYIGGVFGPLISFLTLLAVLKTVYLQRELLDAQREEFDRMNSLQLEAFESQRAQVAKSDRDALTLQVSAAKESAVRLVEIRINMHERDFDRQHDMSFRFREEFGNSMSEDNFNRLQKMIDHRDRARESVDLLSKVALDIAIASFSSVAEVKECLKESVLAVYAKLDAAYPGTQKQIL